ncbi:MAG: cell division protein FtsQ/DivIB [Pseudomonadota bacterium]
MLRSMRDPAPSRMAFRLQRWWLTPFVRRMVRLGFPLIAIAACVGWFFSIEANREALKDQIAEVRRSVAERPEFMVKVMAIDGASAELGEDIREVMPLDFPVSSFDLNLEDMKGVVEELDAVATAELLIKPGGILHLEVTERVPAIIWRDRGILELLDVTGRRVAAIQSRTERPDLPLIVGEGADQAVPEALAIYAAAEPLETRIRGLVRMGERRWDLALDRGQRVMLPEIGGVTALEQVLAIDAARELLARNVTHIDMRQPARPTLRMAESAVEELHRIRALELGE